MRSLVRHLRAAALLQTTAETPDAVLLERFLTDRDDAAFEALLRRHGPMVWGVCRRTLDNRQDAEDAFQATFLVLVRKAGSINPRDLVGHWLYGVAFRIASRARAICRKRRERQEAFHEPAVVAQPKDRDWLPILDREINRLPTKYRVLLVLSALEGMSRKELARRLNLPEGTVSSRLATARKMLAQRLLRQGFQAGIVGLGAALSTATAESYVPTGLHASTQAAFMWITASPDWTGAMVPATVGALARGVIRTMWLAKLRTAVMLIVLTGGLGAAVLSACRTRAADGPKGTAPPSAAETINNKSTKLRPTPSVARTEDGGAAPKKEESAASKRQKRLLRWTLIFDTTTGKDYVTQLNAMGAILAVPQPKGGYLVIRNLDKKPASGVCENLEEIHRIFWIDENPASVPALAEVLGLKPVPPHLVCFFPRYIEDDMLRKELAYAHRREEDIHETRFHLVHTPTRGYEIEVISQTAK